jgi:hypothetical protein
MFVHNLRALWRRDAHLALRLDAIDDDRRLVLEPTRSGRWTAKVHAEDGRSVYLHSRYDPVVEAERLVADTPLDDKFCFVVVGMGLGYHVRALAEVLRGDAFICVVEPSLPTLATALTCVDLAAAIDGGQLIFIVDEDKARLHERLKPVATLMMIGAQFVRHAPSIQTAGERQAALSRLLVEFVTYTRMSLMTLVGNSQRTCRNIAMNLVHTVTTPPIDVLRDRFAGDPAVIIAAGPSLRRNIDALADLKGRALLCAVQTALRPLMERGIVPDFVTTLDFHEMSRKFFDGIDGLEGVHLVAEPKVAWNVLDDYPGPISLLGNEWAKLVLGPELGERAGLRAGATVAHLAFYLAVYMGCDPIIFVGQDLAFTGHVFYVPGVEVHRTWRGELNRFHTMEMKEWERIARNRPILRRVLGNDGSTLYADELLFTYLEQFEKDIASTQATVINATEGGARIRGAGVMTLHETAERHCARPIDTQRFEYRTRLRWRDPANVAATRGALEQRIGELARARTVCEELLTLFDELDGLVHDPQRFNRRLARVDELRTRIHQESRAYRIINQSTQMVEFRRYIADRRIKAATADGAEIARRQIARDREFITGVRDGARDLEPVLREALQRMYDPRLNGGAP